VLTAGHIDRVLIYKKGFDVIAGAAQQLPDIRFLIAGRIPDEEGSAYIRRMPKNVEHLGSLSQTELISRLQTATVYFQPSRHESFGVAVIEAMSCGCVPVVSGFGALPEVVGDAGFVLDRLDAARAAEVLSRALSAPDEARRSARARVIEHFDIKFRAEKLARLIDELLGRQGF
jgi:glycosyltransferase involved in cell wall biosynthesis